MSIDLKIKLWYLFKVNKKQFIVIYLIFSFLVFAGIIAAFYYNPTDFESMSWINKFYYKNDVVFWVIMALYTIIEALFFWNKFNAEHIKIINEQNIILEKQKEEIASQNEEIATQRDNAIEQKEKIEEQNKLIKSSIFYAERIQNAVLPLKNEIDKNFENFIIYKPRDIVSGDFYWFKSFENLYFIAAADCTGHGVPGAFVSMLGISLLNEIVSVRKIKKSNEILNTLRTEIKISLHQSGQPLEQQDGMDIALVVIDKNNQKIDYAGANNSLLLYTENIEQFNPESKNIKVSAGINKFGLIEIKPNRMPIGIYTVEKDFSSFEFDYSAGDCIYLFSDGYVDQFGGENHEKFTTKRLKEYILGIADSKIEEQKYKLLDNLSAWIGKNEQIDDILVMGIKLM